MNIEQFLAAEWMPALGCTEPASIAYAGLIAAEVLGEEAKSIHLKVDAKIYKNCFAVGIPHSGHKTGIKWAASIGAFLKNRELGLQCFDEIDGNVLKKAARLIKSNKVTIEIDKSKTNLFIEITLTGAKHLASCKIENAHTNVTLVSRDGKVLLRNCSGASSSAQSQARKWASSLTLEKMIGIAKRLTAKERKNLLDGARLNLKIARHGLKLLPKEFFGTKRPDIHAKATALVGSGVYARMWGESFTVMSVAGSGNKGITICVPIVTLQEKFKLPQKRVEEALVIAMLVTSKTTHELGTLSAVCGCSNAAGIGLACALVHLHGGGAKEMSLAINNMVGNITGMICDGAKIGCAMKSMTSVDAAFRSASLAMCKIGIPPDDGIVGKDGTRSLVNMGRIANNGMTKTDEEILKIMEDKLSG